MEKSIKAGQLVIDLFDEDCGKKMIFLKKIPETESALRCSGLAIKM
jgi:hypothetical protein